MCSACWSRLQRQLARTDDILEDLELTGAGRDKIRGAPTGRISHSSSSPMPVRPHVVRAADRLRNALSTWVRDLWETHAIRWQDCDTCDARWLSGDKRHTTPDCGGSWVEKVAELGHVDHTSAGLARWVLRHQNWVKTHPAADELHADLLDAYADVLRVIDRPDDRLYLGICSAELENGELCEVDLFARQGQTAIRCRGCDSAWNVHERREYLTAAVDHQYLPSNLVIAAVTRRAHHLTQSMLRNYRARGRLTAYVHDESATPDEHGHQVRPIRDDDDQVALYRVSEVVDVLTTKYRRTSREAS
ncbi:hypothetical protein [Kibdelosporangium philippinense]